MSGDGSSGGWEVSIYAIGLLWAIQADCRGLVKARRRPQYLWRELRAMVNHLRFRKWHQLQNAFMGYLAEPTPMPTGVCRCGHGWTKARALADLERETRRAGHIVIKRGRSW